MDAVTRKKLTEITHNFYQTVGDIWNPRRDYVWEGWHIIARTQAELFQRPTLRVLDIGCGNGRFADFLASTRKGLQTEYCGVDNSSILLQFAEVIRNLEGVTTQLIEVDFVTEGWVNSVPQLEYDVVVLFGVIHHMPGRQFRSQFIQACSRFVSHNGLMITTTWQFLDVPRLQKRVVDPATEVGRLIFEQLDINPLNLEPGDHILDWVKLKKAYRYSHAFTEAEMAGYWEQSGLICRDSFSADGRFSNRNTYYVCTHAETAQKD